MSSHLIATDLFAFSFPRSKVDLTNWTVHTTLLAQDTVAQSTASPGASANLLFVTSMSLWFCRCWWAPGIGGPSTYTPSLPISPPLMAHSVHSLITQGCWCWFLSIQAVLGFPQPWASLTLGDEQAWQSGLIWFQFWSWTLSSVILISPKFSYFGVILHLQKCSE